MQVLLNYKIKRRVTDSYYPIKSCRDQAALCDDVTLSKVNAPSTCSGGEEHDQARLLIGFLKSHKS